MGCAVSSDLVPPFDYFGDWDYSMGETLLQVYREKDYDFGIDAATILKLLSEVKENPPANIGDQIVKIFSKGSGLINALSLITGIIYFSLPTSESTTIEEKCGVLFNAFDFDDCGEISYDELTILLFSLLRAVVIMTGSPASADPSDEQMEKLSDQVYSKAGKHVESNEVTKDDFTAWVKSKVDPKFNSFEIMNKAGLADAITQAPKAKVEASNSKSEKTKETPVFEAEESATGDQSAPPAIFMFEQEQTGTGDQSLPPQQGVKLVEASAEGPISFTAHKINSETIVKAPEVSPCPVQENTEACSLQEQEEAAIKIQTRIRGVEGREKARKRKVEVKKREDAAIKIQTRIRGVEGREKARRKKAELEFRKKEEFENRAAVKIQAQARGRMARQRMVRSAPSMPSLAENENEMDESHDSQTAKPQAPRFQVKDNLMGGLLVVDIHGMAAQRKSRTFVAETIEKSMNHVAETKGPAQDADQNTGPRKRASQSFVQETVNEAVELVADTKAKTVQELRRTSVNLVEKAIEDSMKSVVQTSNVLEKIQSEEETADMDFGIEDAATGDQSMAPAPMNQLSEPPAVDLSYKKGDDIIADFLGMGLRRGQVANVNSDGSYDIAFDHGAKEVKVSKKKIQKEIPLDMMLRDLWSAVGALEAASSELINANTSFTNHIVAGAVQVREVSAEHINVQVQSTNESLDISYTSHQQASVSKLADVESVSSCSVDDDEDEWRMRSRTITLAGVDLESVLSACTALNETAALLQEFSLMEVSNSISQAVEILDDTSVTDAGNSISGAIGTLETVDGLTQQVAAPSSEDEDGFLSISKMYIREHMAGMVLATSLTDNSIQEESQEIGIAKMYLHQQAILSSAI